MTGKLIGRPDYGIDSPAMVIGELALAGVAAIAAWLLLALGDPHLLGIPVWGTSLAIGFYLLVMAGGMLDYSLRGKLRIRDLVLRSIAWSGHERVLDVGCRPGLLLVGAAQRLSDGKATGVDRWAPGAVSGNGPAALRSAELAGVANRVAVCDGDARKLPYPDATFDIALSNFVLRELAMPAERAQMLREISRALRAQGMSDVQRTPAAGWFAFASFALLTLGLGRLYLVTGVKGEGTPQSD
jgi:SAM-dependent methyltransferase